MPPWILVVTSISNAVITLGVFSLVMTIFLASAGHMPTAPQLVAFAAYCAALTAIVIGFSLAASVLFLRYRDLNQVWDVVLQAGFFIAPIIYPLTILPERFHILLVCLAADTGDRVLARRAGCRPDADADRSRVPGD